MDEGPDIAAFAEARLADDERYMRVLTAAGERKADSATDAENAGVVRLMETVLADPEALAEVERWAEHDLMPPGAPGQIDVNTAMKRQILRWHRPNSTVIDEHTRCYGCFDSNGDAQPYPCQDVRVVVATWCAHPDWRSAWIPKALLP